MSVAEFCIVWVESDGWSFKEMEPVFDTLEEARQAAQERSRSGLPELGVADRRERKLVWRASGESLDLSPKFQVWPTG